MLFMRESAWRAVSQPPKSKRQVKQNGEELALQGAAQLFIRELPRVFFAFLSAYGIWYGWFYPIGCKV